MSRRLKFLYINEKLRTVLNELETHLGIEFDKTEVEQVFEDAENDQVSFKSYVFYSQKSLLFADWEISGVVDEYEPDILVLKSTGGIGKKRMFDSFFSNDAS